MKNLSLAALLAAGVFAIYTAPSFAISMVGGTGGPGPKPPCTVNCGGGDSTSPGDPFFPPGGGDDPEDDPKDDPTDPGDGPKDDPKDDPTDPGDGPKDDPKDDPKDEPGNDPDYPGLTKQEVAELRACLARLEGLAPVSATEINQFGQPYKVTLNPICEAKSLTDVQPVLVEGGNVAGLETALKSNDLIKTKLGQTAYKARDVVGIDFDEKGNATLFVHKRG
jgi:hypothetical protein